MDRSSSSRSAGSRCSPSPAASSATAASASSSAPHSAMPAGHSPSQNHLLAALPPADFERLAPHLELVPMPLGEVLYEPGQQMLHAYFPTTCIVSMQYVMASGASAESAGVGNEG